MTIRFNLYILLLLVFGLNACGQTEVLKVDGISKNEPNVQASVVNPQPAPQVLLSPTNPSPMVSPEEPVPLEFHHQEPGKPFMDFPNAYLPEVSVEAYAEQMIEPGKVQLVFKKDQYVILSSSPEKNWFIQDDGRASTKAFKELVEQYQVSFGYDLGKGMTTEEIETDQKRMQEHYQGYIPDRRAIQNYTFPEKTDLVELIKKLRALPSVYSANLSYLIGSAENSRR